MREGELDGELDSSGESRLLSQPRPNWKLSTTIIAGAPSCAPSFVSSVSVTPSGSGDATGSVGAESTRFKTAEIITFIGNGSPITFKLART